MVGRQALEIEFLKGALKNAPRPRSVNTSVIAGPAASPSQKDAGARDLTIVAEMKTICDEFEAYGYRLKKTRSHGTVLGDAAQPGFPAGLAALLVLISR